VELDAEAPTKGIDVPAMLLARVVAGEVGGRDIGDCLLVDADDLEWEGKEGC
jgi:hypothetical protein